MQELVQPVLNSDQKTEMRQLVDALRNSDKQYFLRNEILHAFAEYCHQSQKPPYFFHASSLGQLLHYTHELILEEESTWLLVRPSIASQQVWRLSADLNSAELMTPQALLNVRDRLVNRYQPQILEIDVSPFYKYSQSIDDPRNIGQGLTFLNRHLCSQVANDRESWLDILFQVLHQHQYNDIPLLINDRIQSGHQLSQQVKHAIELLVEYSPGETYQKFHVKLQELGLEPGWGNTASRVRDSLELLSRLMDNPEPALLEAFVSRIPSVFRVVLISVHGWVGQENILGRSQTAGQVVYVLDQARSLENRLWEDIKLAGLDFLGIQPQIIVLTRLIPNCEGTACNLRREKIDGTENAWILRVPFSEFNSKVTQNWISKFEIWPYLEDFALNAEKELLAELGGKPNLIIGNYSDGNLVAFLIARRLKVTHCNIAHSLEKPKHLFSNLYWQDLEEQYHFSAQFTADLISMNAADFIVASSYQEIVGTPDTMGQYESYKCFTMPNLYHVVDGIDLFNSKFNVVTPGVNEQVFFPYTENRDSNIRTKVDDLLFKQEDSQIRGNLANPEKRPIFAVAPINSIKNLAGLAECFGKSQALQEKCNLILLTSKLHPREANNSEEAREIERIHEIIDRYDLHDRIRWVGMRLPSPELGEAYRVIADRGGMFIHFALFEAFGLTILEAMISGLPTFATLFGGALEIMDDGVNGFYINPTDFEGTSEKIVNFINQCDANNEYWQEISRSAIERVRTQYNWQLHTKQLLSLAKIYSFWNYIYRDNRDALIRYLEALFFLIYKPRTEKILADHMQR